VGIMTTVTILPDGSWEKDVPEGREDLDRLFALEVVAEDGCIAQTSG